MSDRDLLELAAKAAGVVGEYHREHQTHGDQWVDGIDTGARFWWNPLVDDADAFRLAVKLRIRFATNEDGGGYAESLDGEIYLEFKLTSPADELIAIRRAIVKLAAKIAEATNGN